MAHCYISLSSQKKLYKNVIYIYIYMCVCVCVCVAKPWPTIHIYLQKHIQHNKDEWTQFFWKTYLSLYWKGCVWEVSWRLNRTATYWPPPTLLAITVFLSRSLGLIIPASSLQLIWTSCRRGYIIIWRPPTSHSIQPVDSQGYPSISSTWCTCYLHRCISYFDSSAGGQYATCIFDL